MFACVYRSGDKYISSPAFPHQESAANSMQDAGLTEFAEGGFVFSLEPVGHGGLRGFRMRKPGSPEAQYIVDARDQVLGRLATRIATVLRGKHKPAFSPHVDGGDFVVVVNAGEVRVTGRKLADKRYWRHSGYIGGIRSVTLERMLQTHPERVIESAVRGMLPRGPLGRKLGRKLKVYASSEHPHGAQKPEPMETAS